MRKLMGLGLACLLALLYGCTDVVDSTTSMYEPTSLPVSIPSAADAQSTPEAHTLDFVRIVDDAINNYDVTAIDPIDEKYYALVVGDVVDAYRSGVLPKSTGGQFAAKMPDGVSLPADPVSYEQLFWGGVIDGAHPDDICLPLSGGYYLAVSVLQSGSGEGFEYKPERYEAIDAYFIPPPEVDDFDVQARKLLEQCYILKQWYYFGDNSFDVDMPVLEFDDGGGQWRASSMYDTKEDMYLSFGEVFVTEAVNEILDPMFEGPYPFFREVDGRIYYNDSGGGSFLDYSVSGVDVISSNEHQVELNVTYAYTDPEIGPDWQKTTYLTMENDGWRLSMDAWNNS